MLGVWRGWFDPASLSLEMRLRLGLGQEGTWEALERRDARPTDKNGEASERLPRIERPRSLLPIDGKESLEQNETRPDFNWGDWL